MINQLKRAPHLHSEVDNYRAGSEGCGSDQNKNSTNGRFHSKLHLLQQLCICCLPTSEQPVGPATPLHNHKPMMPMSLPGSPVPRSAMAVTGSPMHTRAILSTTGDSPRPYAADLRGVTNLDLICSIADTYDLPSDSDTYSYISNCLMQRSYESTADSRSRRLRRSRGSLHDPKLANNDSNENHSRRRSRSHSASRKTRYKCGSNVNATTMTDSNCSTVIL